MDNESDRIYDTSAFDRCQPYRQIENQAEAEPIATFRLYPTPVRTSFQSHGGSQLLLLLRCLFTPEFHCCRSKKPRHVDRVERVLDINLERCEVSDNVSDCMGSS